MLTSRHIGWSAALVASMIVLGCSGADGLPGPQGDPGPVGSAGPPGADGKPGTDGNDAVLEGELTGTVTDGANPLDGVTVTVDPGTATATTDAQGKFALKNLDIGSHFATFTRAGFLDQTIAVTVTSSGPTTLAVSLAVDPSTVPPPSVSVSDVLKAGFAKPVTLKATAAGKAPFAYQWTQIAGPSVALSGDETDTLSFTTQDFASAMGPKTMANARFGVLGINADQAGNYVFEVAVTDASGLTTKARVVVNATRPTTGLRMVPVGVPVWLQGDGHLVSATQATWSWTLDKAAAPSSMAAIDNPTSQFPSFVPDVKGTYKLTETVSNKTLTIYAGYWLGEMTPTGDPPSGTCALCHTGKIASDNFTPWKGTRHFKGLKEKLDGVTTDHFAEECLSCHTVGYDKTAGNGGFDDLESGSGWSFPATLQPGNWDTLANNVKLGPLAGVQCESCHGPQSGPTGGPHTSSAGASPDAVARISWSSDVCASCHQHEPYNYKPMQWSQSKHADLELAYVDATVETRGLTAAHCGRCHTAQGFAQYVRQLQQGYTGNLTADGKPLTSTNAATTASLTKLGLTQATVQGQTCQACHDPHDATHPAQLRIYDTVPGLPNGMGKIAGVGSGMVCIACHNTRNGERSDFVAAPTSYTAPHAPAQADVLFGFNTYFMPRYNPSAHLAVKDTCAGCHYGVATEAQQMAKQDNNHSFKVDNTICAACHGSDVNGEALEAANEQALEGLALAIMAKVKNLIDSALLPANGGQYMVRVWDPASGNFSSTSASNVALTAAPVSLDPVEIRGQVGFILHMPAPLTVNLVSAAGAPAGSITTSDLYVAAGSLRNAAASAPLFAAGSDYNKALWNYFLLHGDGTRGIHNPSFFNALIAATSAKIAALP